MKKGREPKETGRTSWVFDAIFFFQVFINHNWYDTIVFLRVLN